MSFGSAGVWLVRLEILMQEDTSGAEPPGQPPSLCRAMLQSEHMPGKHTHSEGCLQELSTAHLNCRKISPCWLARKWSPCHRCPICKSLILLNGLTVGRPTEEKLRSLTFPVKQDYLTRKIQCKKYTKGKKDSSTLFSVLTFPFFTSSKLTFCRKDAGLPGEEEISCTLRLNVWLGGSSVP